MPGDAAAAKAAPAEAAQVAREIGDPHAADRAALPRQEALESLEVPAICGERVQRGATLDLEATEVLVDQRRGIGDDSRGPPLRGRSEPRAHGSHPEREAKKATAPALADACCRGHHQGVPCERKVHGRVYHRRPAWARFSGGRTACRAARAAPARGSPPPSPRTPPCRPPTPAPAARARARPAPARRAGAPPPRRTTARAPRWPRGYGPASPRPPHRAARPTGGGAASRARSR